MLSKSNLSIYDGQRGWSVSSQHVAPPAVVNGAIGLGAEAGTGDRARDAGDSMNGPSSSKVAPKNGLDADFSEQPFKGPPRPPSGTNAIQRVIPPVVKRAIQPPSGPIVSQTQLDQLLVYPLRSKRILGLSLLVAVFAVIAL